MGRLLLLVYKTNAEYIFNEYKMSPCVTPLKIRKSALQSFLAGVLEGDPSPGKQNADPYHNHFLAFLCGLSPRYLAQNSVC